MILSQRSKSFTNNLCKHNKPKYQTKYKNRTNTKSTMQLQTSIINNGFDNNDKLNKTTNNKKSYIFTSNNKCKLDENNFEETSQKLQQINFSHHNKDICVCAQCTCGRHLCQFHSIKPNLSKNTIYKKVYMKKKPIKNRINISTQYDRFNGPNLDINSIYDKDYQGRSSQVQKHKPQDNLKSNGPSQQLTSYSSGFPGYRCGNQYVKPTDKYIRGYFPLRSRSTYTRVYTGDQRKKDQWERVPDNLKTGSNWYGSTTYGGAFKKPNPQDYSMKAKIEEKLENNPNFSRQYETIYRNTFVGHQSNICPAKVKLETKSKGFFSEHKDNFSQNTDFRSLDPNFHSFSTSQHKWA